MYVKPNFSDKDLVSSSFLPTRCTSLLESYNCVAKLDPIEPVAPTIKYFLTYIILNEIIIYT